MACTYDQMKENLKQARKSTPIPTTDSQLKKLKDAGISKKVICQFFGISYQELKMRTQTA